VAFVLDSAAEGGLERTLPALQAVELGFATASLSSEETVAVDLVPLDIHGSETAESQLAAQIAGDPSYVAAIAAPDLPGQGALASALAGADVPLLSLSARDSASGAAPGTWLRFVAPIRVQAEVMAGTASSLRASRRGVCVVATTPDGSDYARAVARSLSPDLTVSDVPGADGVAEAGCGVVLWTGGAEGGAELAGSLETVDGRRPVLLGGPGLRDRAFLEHAGDAANGTISLCSCADVGTSLDLAAQRFVQDYQSEYGSPPGPYAVEGWDAAHALVRALREAGPARGDLVGWLAALTTLDGLGGPYAFRAGELADPASSIHRYRVEGGRWVVVEPR
jgi:branched-chain amino acid transport system substrate-binding protein